MSKNQNISLLHRRNGFRQCYGLVAVLAAIAVLFSAGRLQAFPTDIYASSSALSSGKWVKISVDNSGLYCIPSATLRSWGFSDPSKVQVYGYGGRCIPDLLSQDTYIDDLPATPTQVTDAGVVFYAAGPDTWAPSVDSYYHGSLNLYSSKGYYFVTENDSVSRNMVSTASAGAVNPVKTAQGRVHHEQEMTQASTAGPLFVGEDFLNTRSRSFTVATPGRVPDTDVWMECSFFHVQKNATSVLRFTADNSPLTQMATDIIPAMAQSTYAHGSMGTTRHLFKPANNQSFSLGITYSPGGNATKANLDYLSFNYVRSLELPSEGHFTFWSEDRALSLKASEGTFVWDVTDPADIRLVKTASNAGRLEWTATVDGMRSYAAWRAGAALPAPAFVANVSPQNLHGQTSGADMVIITPAAFLSQANRIAKLHQDEDGMVVHVVDQDKIYNEFSSGTYDVGGIRKYLKFVYDKSAKSENPLKYVLLLGRVTLDHRVIQKYRATDYEYTVPWWVVKEPRNSMSDNDGYGTDDFISFLEDNSGIQHGLDVLSVAVGRIPVLNAAEADDIIDKLHQYIQKSKKTGWKNHMIVLADDEDQGVHLSQAENLSNYIYATERQQNLINKIYIDAYEKVGSEYPEARREMFRLLDEGVAWWIFTGHANDHSWTGEGMLTYKDINTMYLKNLPLVLASTCDFLRWDSGDISGGEIMYKERNGGCINMISATRPVYISDNGYFLNAFGRKAMSRDADGRLVRSGEAYRLTKNDIRNNSGTLISNTNRLRFVFMGDPALAVATPSNIVEITAINGIVPDSENQTTIAALSTPVIEGQITDPEGNVLSDFDGVLSLDIFDSDYSVTTLAHGDGREDVYDRHGNKLFAGSTTVTKGKFSLKAPMPSQIADNFRQATMSAYAYATNSNDEAVGRFRDFYIYGFEEPATADTQAPAIKTFVLNHAGFFPGDIVNTSPMAIAAIEDNVGLNLSFSGVGHQMHMTLDDFTTYTDVASYYTPSTDGSASGVINYPLEGLLEGPHTLTLRIFDTSGNTSAQSIDFYVSESAMPSIFEVYTDANPASTSASFYVRHDRPDMFMDVEVTVYNLLGQPIWSGSAKGLSDSDVSSPVVWDLCDSAGRRVQRGIYLYRASITTDSERYQTASQRIAVTAQ